MSPTTGHGFHTTTDKHDRQTFQTDRQTDGRTHRQTDNQYKHVSRTNAAIFIKLYRLCAPSPYTGTDVAQEHVKEKYDGTACCVCSYGRPGNTAERAPQS